MSEKIEKSTQIANDIESAREEARFDTACKKVLSNKPILAWILSSCCSEYEGLTPNQIEQYIENDIEISTVNVEPDFSNQPKIKGDSTEDSMLTEGKIYYDLKFSATTPKFRKIKQKNVETEVEEPERIRLILNIEAQNDFYPGYPLLKRAVYYVSRLISAQNGTVFSYEDYEKIRKVYSIWICINPPKAKENSIVEYKLCENIIFSEKTDSEEIEKLKVNPEIFDLLNIKMIYLGETNEINTKNSVKLLDTLIKSNMSHQEVQNSILTDFGIPMTTTFEQEVNEMCDIGHGIAQKNYDSGFNNGFDNGVLKTLISLIKDKVISLAEASKRMSVSEENFKQNALKLGFQL